MIVALLLSLNNIFASSLTKCRSMFADFILQQEIESVMSRIVTDAQIAYKIDDSYGKLRFYQHEMPSIDKVKDREGGKPWYKLKAGIIYYNGESSPITSGNYLSGVIVRKFDYYLKPDHPKLLYITIEAESSQTKHKITLTTEVYMRGLQ